jgi:hypothetical protein
MYNKLEDNFTLKIMVVTSHNDDWLDFQEYNLEEFKKPQIEHVINTGNCVYYNPTRVKDALSLRVDQVILYDFNSLQFSGIYNSLSDYYTLVLKDSCVPQHLQLQFT